MLEHYEMGFLGLLFFVQQVKKKNSSWQNNLKNNKDLKF